MKPRMLDLFCGAGGAAVGYQRAGFDVFGVDTRQRVAYPFDRAVGDALAYAEVHGFRFDAIHASPPCQRYSAGTRAHGDRRLSHPDLVDATRDLLTAIGKPWVIENVVGSPLRSPLTLCGTMFDLTADDPRAGVRLYLRRHRWFETPWLALAPGDCAEGRYRAAGYVCGGVYGGGSRDRDRALKIRRGGYTPDARVGRALMGIDWMAWHPLTQSIPPAYTEWIGRQLINQIEGVTE